MGYVARKPSSQPDPGRISWEHRANTEFATSIKLRENHPQGRTPAREVFQRCPQVKKRLWGGEFWSDGYFASTVGKHGDEAKIGKYV
jgi:REP element-mobilizing transposase RayT